MTKIADCFRFQEPILCDILGSIPGTLPAMDMADPLTGTLLISVNLLPSSRKLTSLMHLQPIFQGGLWTRRRRSRPRQRLSTLMSHQSSWSGGSQADAKSLFCLGS